MNASANHNCKEELRSVSLKATPARIAVMKVLEKSDKPLDISTIISYLNSYKVKTDPATIFRIMNSFLNRSLVKQIQLNEGKFRYELLSKGDHHHLICEKCGSIEDISDTVIPSLERNIREKHNFLVKSHSLEFFGICKLCQR